MSVDYIQTSIELDKKRHLRTLLREQKRRRGKNDLHFLCTNVLGYKDLTPPNGFHGEYCRFIENREDRFKLTLMPRGSLKSSIGTIGLPIQEIVNNPNTRGLIASKKFSNSTKFLEEIIGHIEGNEEFRSLYGDLVGKKKWSQSEITVSTRTLRRASSTISCAGIDVTKVGMHYDWIIVDDPHDEENTANQDQIEKVIRWYKLLFSLLDPGGWLNITGTIWHFNDLYNYIQNKELERKEKGLKPRFKVFKRDSFKGSIEELMEDKIPKKNFLWHKRLSPDFLKDQYIEQGPYIFSCQYRLNPVDDETAIFKRSWIKTCDYTEIPKSLSVFSTIDPMRDEEGKDYLAIVTAGMDKDWKCYLLDVKRLKADEHETVEQIFKTHDRWKFEKAGMETVAWQLSYYKYVKMLQILRGKVVPMVELKTSTRVTKHMRIKGMVPYWKAGLFIIPCPEGDLNRLPTGTGMSVLIDELTRYPKTANDDTIDALAYMNQLTHRPGVLHIIKRIHPRSFMGIRAKLKPKKRKLGKYNVRKRNVRANA